MATIALLAVGLASAGYSAYQAHEVEQDEKMALNKQKDIQEKQTIKKRKQILEQQKASFLASGISLTGSQDTPQDFFDETNTATAEDMAMIGDYYSTQIGNSTGRARAKYIGAIGSAVSSVAGAYSSTYAGAGTGYATDAQSKASQEQRISASLGGN